MGAGVNLYEQVPERPNPNAPVNTPTGVPLGQSMPVEEMTSPEPGEQDQYDQIVMMAQSFIHSPETADAVIGSLNDKNLPIHDAVGKTCAMIGQMCEQAAKSAGIDVSADAMAAAAEEVIDELMTVGEAAGIFEMTSAERQRETELALIATYKFFGERMLQSGQAPTSEARAYMNEQLALEGSDELPETADQFALNPLSQAVSQATGGMMPSGQNTMGQMPQDLF